MSKSYTREVWLEKRKGYGSWGKLFRARGRFLHVSAEIIQTAHGPMAAKGTTYRKNAVR